MSRFKKFFSFNQSFSIYDFIAGRTGRTQGSGNVGNVYGSGSRSSVSGEQVSEETIWRDPTTSTCIRDIADGIKQLPIHLKKIDKNGDFKLVKMHPVLDLLMMPNVYETPVDFKSDVVVSLLVHGNAFIRIIRDEGDPADGMDMRGKPSQLVSMRSRDITIGSTTMGQPLYTHESFGNICHQNMIHVKDTAIYTPQSQSRALQASEIIGAKLASDRKMNESFKNGVDVGMLVEVPHKLSKNARKTYMEDFKSFASGQDRRGAYIILEAGVTAKMLKGTTPADTDLRALRGDLKHEIAGLFKVPSHMVGAQGGEKYNLSLIHISEPTRPY